MKKILVFVLISLTVNLPGQNKILTLVPDSVNASSYVLDGLKMDKKTYLSLKLTEKEIDKIKTIENPKELKRKHYELFGGKVVEVYSNLNFILNDFETLKTKKKRKVLSKMDQKDIWDIQRVPLLKLYTRYHDFNATEDAILVNANIPEGLSIRIDPPLQDTIIDKVTISGNLINAAGKNLKYEEFYNNCNINWTSWKVMLTKDSLLVNKAGPATRLAKSVVLKRGSTYHFNFCLDINNFYSSQEKFQPTGEYEIWIHYTFGLMQAKSNKIKLYFKSLAGPDVR